MYIVSCVWSVGTLIQPHGQTTSNTGEKSKTVGRGTCSIADNVFRSQNVYALFGKPEWKTIHFLSKPVLLKMQQTKRRYGQVSVTITVSTAAMRRYQRWLLWRPLPNAYWIYGNRRIYGCSPVGFPPLYRENGIVGESGSHRKPYPVYSSTMRRTHIDITDNNANLVPLGEIGIGRRLDRDWAWMTSP